MPKTSVQSAQHVVEPSYEGLHALVDNMPILAWMANADGWIYWYNDCWYEYTGTTPKDMEGWGWQSVHDPSQLKSVLKRWQSSIKTGKQFEMVFPLKRKDGAFLPFLTRVTPVKDTAGKVTHWFGTNTDVSEQLNDQQKIEKLAEAIEKQSKIYDTALSSITDLVHTYSPEGVFLYGNKSMLDLFSLSADEAVGKTLHELPYGKELADTLKSQIDKVVASGKPITAEMKYTDPSGKFGCYEYIYVPVFDKDGRVELISGSTRDITERKKIEAELLQTQVQLDEALAVGSIGTWSLDLATNLVTASETLAKLFGADPHKAKAGTLPLTVFTDSMHEDDRERVVATITQSIQNSTQYETDYRIFDTEGNERWVLARGKNELPSLGGQKRFMGVLIDITDRIRAQEELIASEARFRFVTESMPQQVWTALPNGQLDYVNKQTSDYFEKVVKDVIGDGWQAVLHPDDLPKTIETWTHALQTGETYETEFRLKRASDNTYRWHLVRALPMRNEQGEIIKWFGSNTDIEEIINTTKRRDELEEINTALREQRGQLLELNTAKDEFISLASHQLRTPATGVKQYVSMLLEGYAGDVTQEQEFYLQNAFNSNERQLKILNDLLKVAKVDSGKVSLKLAKVSLVPLLNEIIAEQSAKFLDKRQMLEFKHKGDDFIIPADQGLLRMVFENIIDNASKYSYDGGKICIEVSKVKRGVKIDFTDQGVGISSTSLEKVGQKFVRLDNPLSAHVGGTGLGVYWVKKVIDLHQGKLNISSKVGKGSTFSILLSAYK